MEQACILPELMNKAAALEDTPVHKVGTGHLLADMDLGHWRCGLVELVMYRHDSPCSDSELRSDDEAVVDILAEGPY
jgi:hypothetical protein